MSRTGLSICAILLAVFELQVRGQEEIPAGARGGGRGGRGGTREFLGLGRAPDAQAAARGEKLYAPNCAFCHGEKARGAAGPNLVRSEIVLHDEKGELIGPAVSKGRVDKGMPAFAALTEAQLADIGEFLHMQVELVANRGIYKRLNVVTGDAKAGETYFNGAGGCAQCHSISGDLAHIGGKYQPEQLQTRFIWPGGGGFGGGGRGAARPQRVTVTLRSGQSIAGTVKQIDDFDISIYDASGAYHSWPIASVQVALEDRLAGHRRLLDQYTDADMHNLTAYLISLK